MTTASILNVLLLIFLNNGEYLIIAPEINTGSQAPYILDHKKLEFSLSKATDIDSNLLVGNNSFVYYIDEQKNKLLNYGHIKDIITHCPMRDDYRNEWILGNKNSSILTFNLFDFSFRISNTPEKKLRSSFMFLVTMYDLFSYNDEFLETQHIKKTLVNPITFETRRRSFAKEKKDLFLLDSKVYTLPESITRDYKSLLHSAIINTNGSFQFELTSKNQSQIKNIGIGKSIHSAYQVSFFSKNLFTPFIKHSLEKYENVTVSGLEINKQETSSKESNPKKEVYINNKNELVLPINKKEEFYNELQDNKEIQFPLVPLNTHAEKFDQDKNLIPFTVHDIPTRTEQIRPNRSFVDELLVFDYVKIASLLSVLLILFLITIQIKHIIKEYRMSSTTNGLNKITIFKDKVLGCGEGGTVVFEGKFEGRDVAVKRMLKVNFEKVKKEVDSLIKADSCPYIVRYFTVEEDDSFFYLALEKCVYNLETYLKKRPKRISKRIIMRSIASGIKHIHSVGLIHRDIKPQNVLIDEKENIKVADLGIAKELDSNTTTNKYGTLIWMAPEHAIGSKIVSSNEEKTKSDIFSLGCLFYYILTNGNHPFGEEKDRIKNLIMQNFRVDFSSIKTSIREILTMMLNKEPRQRPLIKDVLSYPYFWTPDTKIKFIVIASDKLEAEFRYGKLITYLNIFGSYIYDVKKGWKNEIDKQLLSEIESFRGYDTHSFLDFLRAFRNIWNHFNDIKSAETIIGRGAENYMKYYQKLFPGFILFLWSALGDCKDMANSDLKDYYSDLSEVIKNTFVEKKNKYKTRTWYKITI